LFKKKVPKMKEYEDDGTWIWVSYASECRLVIAHAVGERKQYMADKVVGIAKKRLASMPLFVTDGLKFYIKALLKHYSELVTFPPTGKKGRPRKPKLKPIEGLKYTQIIKYRKGGRIDKVIKRVLFGNHIDMKKVSTSLIERLNLTLRQDNNRISRKTIGFSKKLKGLKKQMALYFANYNFCREHSSLKYEDENGITRKNCPAKEYGLIDHNWSLRELSTFPYYITSTG
jgi:IS1 family transposase